MPQRSQEDFTILNAPAWGVLARYTGPFPDTSIINCRPGEAESRALLKITRLLGDLLPAERERVLADINAKYSREDDHK